MKLLSILSWSEFAEGESAPAIELTRTDDDLPSALAEVERLWGSPEDSREGDKLDILATLIDA